VSYRELSGVGKIGTGAVGSCEKAECRMRSEEKNYLVEMGGVGRGWARKSTGMGW